MSAPKLFTAAWADEAVKAEAAHADVIRAGFKDAGTFTHVLALEATDTGEIVHAKYVSGHLQTITTDLFDETEVWSRFAGTADTWRQAADGTQPAANLVMAAKLKLTKGDIADLIHNTEAFNRFNIAFGDVETDYSA